jgi:hypothetical protein
MMNLIFNNVLHKSGETKSLNLAIDFCMIDWNVIFEFLKDRTEFSQEQFKISVKNNYYTLKELLKKSSFYETFEYNEFISFNVKIYSNPVIKQIEVLRASISSLLKQGVGVTDLLTKIRELEQMCI